MNRYAIYYTPAKDDALTRLASAWLGRDAFAGTDVPHVRSPVLSQEELAFHTAPARRYGFHATLKAPFVVAEGENEEEMRAALTAFCGSIDPFVVPRLVLRRMDGFFALVPHARCEPLDQLARDVVLAFERFRAPLTDAELGRRNPENLSPLQLRYLHQWGYPYVFDEFRFHMTLTGRVAEHEAPRVQAAIEAHFGPMLGQPMEIGSLALFAESNPGAPFSIRSFYAFRQLQERKSA